MQSVFVHDLPQNIPQEQLAGRTVVVVDLLRASSTICRALASGARAVIPFVEVDAARRAASASLPGDILLGGERGGRPIAGFDLGNSPAEYEPRVVSGKKIIFTTTNGAKAIHHAQFAARVAIGALVNRLAAVTALRREPHIDILCSGTDGEVTDEDLIAAGAFVDLFLADKRQTNATAEEALQSWQGLLGEAKATGRPLADKVAEALATTVGGRRLTALGMESDLRRCAQIDVLDVVPELDRASGELRIR